MSSTSFSSSVADLPAVLHNAARRFGGIYTGWTQTAPVGGIVVVTITWPDETVDPGDPGPDPAVTNLGNALSALTDNLVNEQTRISNLFAERIDLQRQRDELAADKAQLAADKATAESSLRTATLEKENLEQTIVLRQKEIDDLKAAKL